MTPLDETGAMGGLLHYAFAFALMGSAFLVFLTRWRSGKLDMDEEPKWQMMQSDEE